MAALTALAAICTFAAGAAAGITAVVAVAIRREDRTPGLTSAAPDTVTRTGRWLTGLHVRAPRRTATGLPGEGTGPAAQEAGPGTSRTGPWAGPSLPGFG